MSRRAAIWLGFGLVLLHNLEELLTMSSFLARRGDLLPSLLRSMTGARFALSLVLATLLMLAATCAAARSRVGGPWLVLGIALHVGLGVNAIQHGAIAAWTRGYAPGVVSALALILPYSVYLASRALRERWVTGRALVGAAAAVVALTIPLILLLHALSALSPFAD